MNEPVSVPSGPTPWWDRWPGRLEYELAAFHQRDIPITVVEDPRSGAERLILTATVEVPGFGGVPVSVIFPDSYPYTRFSAIAPTLPFERHRSPDGTLCLMPRGHRGWQSGQTAASVLAEKLPRLAELIAAGGDMLRDAEDPQGEPITAYFTSAIQGGIVLDDRSVLEAAPEHGEGGTIRFRLTGTDFLLGLDPDGPLLPRLGRGVISDVLAADGRRLNPTGSRPLDALLPVTMDSRWVHLDGVPYETDANVLLDAALSACASLRRHLEESPGIHLLAVHLTEEVAQGVFEPAWTFLTLYSRPSSGRKSGDPRKRQAVRFTGVSHLRGLRRTDTDLGQRIPHLAPMRSKALAVVGLGSLGMPFAQEMVKARIGRLEAIDPDVMDPATAVRHPLGSAAAGQLKVIALKVWAVQHDPDVEVNGRNLALGRTPMASEGIEHSERHIMHEALSGVDLIVGATAEHDVNRQLDDLGRQYGLPRLYVWSQSGYGGLVALLIDGLTGCFHCLELLLAHHATEGDPLVKVGESDIGTTIQGRGCADQTFTAAHPDLLGLSIEAARVAQDTLTTADAGASYGLGVLVMQNRDPLSGRPIPPQWRHIPLPPDPACPSCTAAQHAP